MSKNALTSKTVIGAIVMVLPVLGRLFGVDIGDAEAQQIGEAALTISGLALTIYGRFTAKHDLTLGKGKPTAILLLLLLPLSMGLAACEGGAMGKVSELPAHQQALWYCDALMDSHTDAVKAYKSIMEQADADTIVWLKTEIAPVLNVAKHAIAAASESAYSWAAVVEEGGDWVAAREKWEIDYALAVSAMNEALAVVAQLKQ